MIKFLLPGGHWARVDDEDGDLANLKWIATAAGACYYAVRHVPGQSHQDRLHRVILARKLGRELVRGEIVDHINHDGLDCTRANLRLATPQQNSANARLRSDNVSGFKGVSRNADPKSRKPAWIATIYANGKGKVLGYFDCPIEAARVYNAAAAEQFGEFAFLNPIPDEVSNA